LAVPAATSGRGDYKFCAVDAPEEVPWLLGAKGLNIYDALAAHAPADESRAFAASGYYVLRDGWTRDANYMLVDGGPHGAHEINCGHAHADALAFDLAARGRTLLVDPGTYTYTGAGAWRDYWIVRDRAETSGAHKYDLAFHFAADAAPSVSATDDGCVREVNGERSGLELHVCTQTGGAWHAAEDWVSPAYGARVPAPLYK